jgi:hypothetical protein
MAQVILSGIGSALGGPIGGALGKLAGSLLDRAAIDALTPARVVGRNLLGLQLNSTAEGAPMPCAFGRARLSGQIVWAANFKQKKVAVDTGGGKGGPNIETYSYSLSFAVAVCEGPIDGFGQVWADGQAMDMTGVTMRAYLGDASQTVDPLIEAIEGTAPAYRGTAYVVFEDLVLDTWGARPPELSFEVFRRPVAPGGPPRLEDMLTGVCLIPGAGEFVLATETVLRRDGLTVSTPENVNNPSGRPDILVSLDQLQAQLPHVDTVTLVVGWFGTDLRCGSCTIRPGVEEASKYTIPIDWSVGGLARADAHLISTSSGGPAYGGTPADAMVIEAVAELKARGLKVFLYPFLFMDIPPGNGLPDPYGAAEQAAYPWRGRITGAAGTDKTAAAAGEIAAFFGTATPANFSAAGGAVAYSGPAEWSFRRFILHHAALAQAAGGVDGFVMGSELRGLTTLRSDATTYPAVAALQALAADCRTMLGPACEIGYAADWSEYFGHQPPSDSGDRSNDVFFHLDPLWADPNVSFVGVDWYPPITDWRDGPDNLDAAEGFSGPQDPAYLAARIMGGEDFDWFYASNAARLAQTRTPITDGAYNEPWVFRPKDLISWWSNAHYDRPGGVRSAAPTAWTPQSKPIRLIEFGCPAVDKGSNAPNLFIDPKSSESALPPFSTGARDDVGQRLALEAILAHFGDPASNPTSTVYGAPMVAALSAWCWDARPFPDFPARSEVWADAPDWALGHWLNGRAGAGQLADLLAALMARGGIAPSAYDVSGAEGFCTGYVIDRPGPIADAIAPLTSAYPFALAERGGLIAAVSRDGPAVLTFAADDLALPADQPADLKATRTLKPAPDVIRVRYVDQGWDYQTGQASAMAEVPLGGGVSDLDLPIVMGRDDATRIAARTLRRLHAERDAATLYVGLGDALAAEPGDLASIDGAPGVWRVTQADANETPTLNLLRAEAPDPDAPLSQAFAETAFAPAVLAPPQGPPALMLLDMPPLEGYETDLRPLAAVAASPFTPFDVSAGPAADALTVRATASEPAMIGQTVSALNPGPLYRFDRANVLTVKLESGTLASVSQAALFAGANALAVLTPTGQWEIVQFLTATLLAPSTYALSGLLRAQQGTDVAMAPTPAGAPVVLLDTDLARLNMALSERGLPLIFAAAPAGAPAVGLASTTETFAWQGIAYRPFSPCHLSKTVRPDGTLSFTWIRRARIGGDNWDGEPPLSEETEAYRLTLLNAGAPIRTYQVSSPAADYPPADQAADFPAGVPGAIAVQVQQLSAVFGWGAPIQRTL